MKAKTNKVKLTTKERIERRHKIFERILKVTAGVAGIAGFGYLAYKYGYEKSCADEIDLINGFDNHEGNLIITDKLNRRTLDIHVKEDARIEEF